MSEEKKELHMLIDHASQPNRGGNFLILPALDRLIEDTGLDEKALRDMANRTAKQAGFDGALFTEYIPPGVPK